MPSYPRSLFSPTLLIRDKAFHLTSRCPGPTKQRAISGMSVFPTRTGITPGPTLHPPHPLLRHQHRHLNQTSQNKSLWLSSFPPITLTHTGTNTPLESQAPNSERRTST